MNIALIFHPLKINFTPSYALALISNVLKKEGYNVKIFDLNADFQTLLLNKAFQKKIDKIYNTLMSESKVKLFEWAQNPEKATNINKYNYLASNYTKFLTLQKEYNKMVNILRDKNIVKNAKSILNSRSGLNKFFIIINELFSYGEAIQINAVNSLLREIYNELFKDIYKFKPDFTGISTHFNLFNTSGCWVNIISKNIKENTNSQIFVGGADINYAFINNKKECLSSYEDIDYIIYGYSEDIIRNFINSMRDNSPAKIKNVIKLSDLQRLDNSLNLDNLNDIGIEVDINHIPKDWVKTRGCWDGIDFKKYFIPKMSIPIEISRGCYWNKCEFCIHITPGINYQEKNVDDVIEEIKELKSKYNIMHFTLGTNSLHPVFADEFSKKIIEQKIELYYGTFIRFDKRYSAELLKQLYDSGLRFCAWGFETASPRLLDLYNKGTEIEVVERILQDAGRIGIKNNLYLLMGLLNETQEDVDITMNFITKNIDYIDAICRTQFYMLEQLLMYKHPEKFGYTSSDFKKMHSQQINSNYYEPEELIDLFVAKPYQYLNDTVIDFLFDHSIVAASQTSRNNLLETNFL